MKPISVLVADDSAFMRKVVSDMIASEPGLAVAGVARDGADAIAKARTLAPDVVTLDVEMPVMNGLEALPVLAGELGIPVVMLSSLTQVGADTTFKALQLGAVDFVPKPSGAISLDIAKVQEELVRKIREAAQIHPSKVRGLARAVRMPQLPAGGALAMRRATLAGVAAENLSKKIVVIGTSTGGPRALTQVIPWLPPNLPAGVLIVQHMPAGFTRSLADRLNDMSKIHVAEAAGGEPIVDGRAVLAQGGKHMVVLPDGTVGLNTDPPMHGVRPAVDVTMSSALSLFGRKMVGVIMTGMGSDGADSMVRLKAAGGRTVAEHESTCVVYGMPRAVVERGVADKVVPLTRIADEIVDAVLAL